jgi:phospholipid/cholesterol/gamma-HCH transport system ATP-binding protein
VRVILGGSGCGKSTLLKHVHRADDAGGGQGPLARGVTSPRSDEPERDAVLARIGMLFQGGRALELADPAENVALPSGGADDAAQGRGPGDRARMKLALVSLEHAAHLTPPELSGGMKKRAALARAMALDPEILFCDEPSAGLDPITAAALDDLLLNLKESFGMSVVVVTHELPASRTSPTR